MEGLTVVDLTRVLSGPYCTMMLGDMGARIIKIEQPGRGDDTRGWGPPFQGAESAYFLSINRNKESLTLDLKQPAGRQILERLLDRADIVVENFRPGTMQRLGFDYETVSARWPRIVYCSISGFGQNGPRRDQPGYDSVVQAEGGLMSITGAADGPAFRLGVAIADIVSGLFAAQGITLALLARARTGRGQFVDIGMLDSTVALLTYQAASYFATGRPAERLGNKHPTIVPYETFLASDGEFILAVGNDEQWKRFCIVAGLDRLAGDPRFATNSDRFRHYDEMKSILVERLRTRSRSEWICGAERPGRAVRQCARHRGSAQRSAARGARHDPGARTRDARRHQNARRADQTLGHAGRSALGAADTRPAHGRDPESGSGDDRGGDRGAASDGGNLAGQSGWSRTLLKFSAR